MIDIDGMPVVNVDIPMPTMIPSKNEQLIEAERLINHAVEIMTVDQLSQWTGVRAWIERSTSV